MVVDAISNVTTTMVLFRSTTLCLFVVVFVVFLSFPSVYGFTNGHVHSDGVTRRRCHRPNPSNNLRPRLQPARTAPRQQSLCSVPNDVSSSSSKGLSTFGVEPPSSAWRILRPKHRQHLQNFWTQRTFANWIYFSTGFENVRAMALYGKLVSMCTGNTVRTVTAAVDGRWRDAASPGGLVASYIVGAGLSRWIHLRVQRKAKREEERGKKDVRNAVNGSAANGVEINGSGAVDHAVPTVTANVVKRSVLGQFSRGIVPSILVLYGLAEVFMHSSLPVLATWMQACAYGLLYTTAQELVGGGMIFFAITGHCTVFAKSAVDGIMDKSNTAARKRVLERAEYLLSFIVGAWFAVKCWEGLVASLPGSLARVLQGHAWKGVWYAIAFLGVQYTV